MSSAAASQPPPLGRYSDTSVHQLVAHIDRVDFDTLEAARRWQYFYGGHLFVPEGSARVEWYPPRYTLGQLMRHPVHARGSGVFNPS